MTLVRSTTSSCTEARSGHCGQGAGVVRRATADIELLLSIIIFITIIMLVRGAMQLGRARLEATEDAARLAFQDATANSPPRYDGDSAISPAAGYSGLRGGLPNRIHVARPQRDVVLYAGDPQPLPPFSIEGKAAVPGPPWTFSGYPAGSGDAGATQGWFEGYVAESHAELISPLGLAPAWVP